MKRAIRFTAALVAVLALSPSANALDKVKLSYVISSVEYADFFMAIDKGYFAEEGIEIELEQAGGGVAVPALSSGGLDFTGSGSVAISAILKGAKLKVLFVVDAHPAMQIWSPESVKSFDDLKGKTIAVISRGDTTEIAIRYYLAKHNLPNDTVSYAPLGPGLARSAAVSSGSYPGAMLNANEAEDLKNAGKLKGLHKVVDLRQEISMAYNALATSDALLAKNPDLMRRMARAVLKGVRHVKASKGDTVDILLKHGLSNPTAVALEYDNIIDSITTTGTMAQSDQDFDVTTRAVMLDLPKDKFKASDVFDFTYADKANAELKAENWQPKISKK